MSIHAGGCFCGAIRWEASEIFDTIYFHCSECRRLSGAPVVTWAHIPQAAFI
jgi:hypothetical protein